MKSAVHGRRPTGADALSRIMLLVVFAVAGCAATPVDEQAEQRREETLADILSQPLDADEYGTPRRCISESAYRDFDVLSDRYLVFEGPGDRLWLNELRGRCPGLDRTASLVFRTQGFQICELDQFQISDWFAWPRYQRWPWRWPEGIPCTLGRFQPITADQLDALKAALR